MPPVSVPSDGFARFAQLDCEVRQTYVLDMRPRFRTPEGILNARAYIDAETFVYLSGEFYRDREPDSSVAIWSVAHSPSGDDSMMLVNDLYVPADRRDFLLSLDVDSTKLEIDGNALSKVIFNPRAQMFSDGQM
jgi:hypothetical protein